jgi:hypothetical protein
MVLTYFTNIQLWFTSYYLNSLTMRCECNVRTAFVNTSSCLSHELSLRVASCIAYHLFFRNIVFKSCR